MFRWRRHQTVQIHIQRLFLRFWRRYWWAQCWIEVRSLRPLISQVEESGRREAALQEMLTLNEEDMREEEWESIEREIGEAEARFEACQQAMAMEEALHEEESRRLDQQGASDDKDVLVAELGRGRSFLIDGRIRLAGHKRHYETLRNRKAKIVERSAAAESSRLKENGELSLEAKVGVEMNELRRKLFEIQVKYTSREEALLAELKEAQAALQEERLRAHMKVFRP